MKDPNQPNAAGDLPLPAGDAGGLPHAGDAMSAPDAMPSGPAAGVLAGGHLMRTGFGVGLFLAWILATILWVYTNVHLAINGDAKAIITAICALALLCLLGGMEGLEVAVIDRWQRVWPGCSESYLAEWIAARQLFVALIVTTATLLANRSVVYIPFTSARITGTFWTGVFDLAWTTLSVLWFAQILPKHLGAMNPDRYLYVLRPALFPIVAFVHRVGIQQPGEWTARGVERGLEWSATPEEVARELGVERLSLGSIWRELPAELRMHRKPRRKPHRP